MKKLPAVDTSKPLPFATLMNLETINATTFRSTSRAFMPGQWTKNAGYSPRSYGAHCGAQAVLAAAREMEAKGIKGFVVHSATSAFTVTGNGEIPFVYSVSTVRDGRGFAVKNVLVSQEGSPGPCLSCQVSFKRMGSEQELDFQSRLDLSRYEAVLKGRWPWEHPPHLPNETPWTKHLTRTTNYTGPIFPGLWTHKVDIAAYNDSRPPLDRRALTYYAVTGPMPPFLEDPNLHAVAHIYAADRNSLFAVDNILGVDENWGVMASLTYSVVLHGWGECISLGSETREEGGEGLASEEKPRWFLQEAWTDRFADARIMHHSKLWDEQGRHVATTLQDGLLRLAFDSEEEAEETRRAFAKGRAKGEKVKSNL